MDGLPSPPLPPLAPLAGIRVLDLTQALSGPMGTRLLADLGAEVIKIEIPGIGDAARRMGTNHPAGESLYFMTFNRNKKSMTLDLRNPQGRELFYQLAAVSDVVMDNFRPGVTKRLGVDHETLLQINPSIICGSISGYGQDGPYHQRPAFDSVAQALSGGMSVTGEPDRPPSVMGFAVVDIGGGYGAAVGLLSALWARERTGRGLYLDLSLLDVNVSFQGHLSEVYLGAGNIPQRGGSTQSANLPNGAFLSKDGRYLQVHCATQKFYEVLAESLAANVPGLQGLPQDERFITMDARRRHWPELREVLQQGFSTKTADEWMELMGEILPIAPINDVGQALRDPQVLHRNMVVEAEHPKAGHHRMPGNPIKLGQEETFEPAPTLGQHTHRVLSELLGCSDAEISSLERDGII